MFNAKQLKEKLTLNDYRKIFNVLGVEPDESNSEYWTMPTICHNLKITPDVSKKLYFYLETKTLTCFTQCSTSFDIISLVQKRWELEGRQYIFTDILRWIASVVGLSNESFDINETTIQVAWQNSLKGYFSRKKSTYLGRVYNKHGLDLCLPYYHPMFLNDNISKETMDKFRIGWYAPESQITIPVFSIDGELLGIHCRNTKQEVIDRGYKYIPLKANGEHYKFKNGDALYGINVNSEFIKAKKQVFLFEAQKSVLQCDTFGVHNALALFGMNCSQRQRDIIVNLGVNEVILCLDRQYTTFEGDEFEKYTKNIIKIAKLFKGYTKVSAMTDMGNLLDYKDSPSDKGKEIFDKLYKQRYEIV